MSNPSPDLLLRAPTPTQLSLSFCDGTPRDLKRWIAELPKANLGETARLLYQGLGELNQLLTPSENRLQLLEQMRPEVYYVCKHLERHFLNQSIVLDERPRKIANLCQALQNHLAIGYKQIAMRVASRFRKSRAALLTLAIQRALHCLNGPLIRASQLYSPIPQSLWLDVHQLYQLAIAHQVQGNPVRDELASQTPSLTIEQTYIVALLLGCSRSNQMRQGNIARLAQVLEPWSALVTLQGAGLASCLFAVAPQAGEPPRYTSLLLDEQRPGLVGINTLQLVKAIQDYLELPADQRAESPLPVPGGLSLDTLQHLSAAWGEEAERTFQRTPSQGELTLCIGMSALHYYLGGQRSFSEILKRPDASRPAHFATQRADSSEKDNWALAFDAERHGSADTLLPYEEIQYHPTQAQINQAAANSAEDFPIFSLQIINHSPSGYCLVWPKEVPDQLQAGELVGLQDSTARGWSVAVVRWIRQVRGGTQMGIELIAPHAQPCGLQLVRGNEENSHYLRALLLPEINAIGVPATLLTPRLPFQEGHKVTINTNGDEHRGRLNKRLISTGGFNQFEYRLLDQPVAIGNEWATGGTTGPEEDFGSLWKTL
ncbi:molecular chaperone [Pseudomonas agarici]|uniref:molecular chaperone n=1 Tax=Pseudomonas agarici TaxID=46677 RepID=UPI0015A24C78|nr:molecular chaperone [Pseudomonas agarici]NWB90922.1 molecular chaperone [Pseudomonas agarici]